MLMATVKPLQTSAYLVSLTVCSSFVSNQLKCHKTFIECHHSSAIKSAI